MTRSFGDYVASTVGVISEPEVTYFEITEGKNVKMQLINLWWWLLMVCGSSFQTKKFSS